MGARCLAFAPFALVGVLAAGCGGSGSFGTGLFIGRDVVARPGGGVLVIGYANARRAHSGHCHGRLVAVAFTSSGRRDAGFGKGGVASLALPGEDCMGEIEQTARDTAGHVAIEVTLDRPGDCGDDGCSAHIPAAYLLSARGALSELPGTEQDGLAAIAFEPGGGVALFGTRIFSFSGFGRSGPARQSGTRLDGGFGRAVAVTRNGRVLTLGLASNRTQDGRIGVERRLPDLRPDPSWGKGGLAVARIDPRRRQAAIQPFPTALAATPAGGALAVVSPVTRRRSDGIVIAFDRSGRLDGGFGDRGRLVLPMRTRRQESLALAAAAGGRLYVTTAAGGGPRCRRAILAIGPDGRPERRFGREGLATLAAPCAVTMLAVAPGGALSVLLRQGALGDEVRVLELHPDGSLDQAFANRGTLTLPRLTILR